MELFDCIIIGGGPAGLNAAVVLGRCRRNVLVFDTEKYRNRWSHGMHNYLTRDHVPPSEFLRLCQPELEKYGVRKLNKMIVRATRNHDDVFEVTDAEGTMYFSKKLLVATGLRDNVPELEGFQEMYGKSVFHCPYCDGWEVQDKRLAVYAKVKDGSELAMSLKTWTDTVTYYTDGARIKPVTREYLEACGVTVITEPLEKLVGEEGQIRAVRMQDGTEYPCDALFFVNGFTQACDLAEAFGCNVGRKGAVITNRQQQTNIPGLYVAGDAARDVHFVVVAAAEGAKAGVHINKELIREGIEKGMRTLKEDKGEMAA
ncbi:NAD(P)/FAD-dependent oxidoreductase [Flaviaesturariibacter amylovorans]|uniref:NAD(P)/FAD-dependent oxidoreductase n=1 Tax=Flaviaesturariibacter amylovorans TaxID=1084520 RepID=A0ABP8GNA3_9BACT